MNAIVIVRAHRLGTYKAGQTRPIIVKFREYSDKQLVLQQVFKGKLLNTGKWIGEDFSVNTTNDRKYLRTHLNAAKEVLGREIKTSSIRYKAIHITNIHGKRFVFPLHKVVRNSQTWWKGVRAEPDMDFYFDAPSSDNVGPTPSEVVNDTDNSQQDSDGTQNPVELPVGAEPTPVEEPTASSAATDEANIP